MDRPATIVIDGAGDIGSAAAVHASLLLYRRLPDDSVLEVRRSLPDGAFIPISGRPGSANGRAEFGCAKAIARMFEAGGLPCEVVTNVVAEARWNSFTSYEKRLSSHEAGASKACREGGTG